MAKKKIMVIGLGILGETVARTLAEDGAEVIALDKDPIYVERVKDTTAMAIEGDSTDPKLLEQLGVTKLDSVIVCIGENFPGALMTTVMLLDLGVKHVAVRATSKMHYDLLKKIGAHDVFFVESEMGKAIAHRLQSPEIINEMNLGAGFRIIESPVCEWMVGQTIQDIALPTNYGVQIVAMRDSENPTELIMPRAQTPLESKYNMLYVGKDRDLDKLIKSKA